MIITDLLIGYLEVPLIKPFSTALRTVVSANTIVVKLVSDEGIIGIGDTAPSPKITGETKESIVAVIMNHIKPKLIGKDVRDFNQATRIVETSIVGNYLAKAAVDIALYDLQSKRLETPLYDYLGGKSRTLQTNKTIGIGSTEEMIQDSITAVQQGFNALKVKVGIDSNLDIERLIAIRQAIGKDIEIRVDANQAWSVKEAIQNINMYEKKNLNISLIEQPVKFFDLDGLKNVKDNVSTRIMADESVTTPLDAFKVLSKEAADLINIKIIKNGGLTNALQIANMAETCGIGCMVGCMLESRISLSASVSLALAHPNITLYDLDAPLLYKEDQIVGGVSYEQSHLNLISQHGLGISDIEKIKWL